ncbi:MAG: slipin family protein [Leadbetterella sp.]
MKNVKLKTNEIGIVLKNDAVEQVIESGSFWIWPNKTVIVQEKDSILYSPIDLKILIQSKNMENYIEIIDVMENQIALLMKDGKFYTKLFTGMHAIAKGSGRITYTIIDLNKIEIDDTLNLDIVKKYLSEYVRTYQIESYENAILIVDGKAIDILKGGTYSWWKNSSTITIAKADMRQQQVEISGQEILTKDKANLRMNFFVQFKIKDIMKALFENKEYEKQLYVMLQLALREYVGTLTLDEILDSKDSIADFVMNASIDKIATLGIELISCGVRDIILPGDMKEIMNQVLVAEKKAQANIIMRREETASMRSLLNTAKLMEENETLFKLKEMEYVEKIADKIGSISVSGNGQVIDQLKQIFMKN